MRFSFSDVVEPSEYFSSQGDLGISSSGILCYRTEMKNVSLNKSQTVFIEDLPLRYSLYICELFQHVQLFFVVVIVINIDY